MLAHRIQPGLLAGDICLALAQVQQTTLPVAQTLVTELVGQLAPQALGALGQLHLERVETEVGHPTEGPAGLLAGHMALLADHAGDALLGEVVGRGDAGNASADNHHIGRGRQFVIHRDLSRTQATGHAGQ
ncbi:hypothetical protein D3C84_740890 [compost metagenome]